MYFLLTSDGQRIAVHAYGPREAEESVVMLHGWWMNHRVFEAAVGSLLYKKRRLLLPDLRGFGGSAGAEAGVFLARMALDVYELVKLENLRNITFVGHGLGAAAALRYLRLFSEFRVRRAVMISAGEISREAVHACDAWCSRGSVEAATWFCREMWAQPPNPAHMRWAEQAAFGASGIAAAAAWDAWKNEDWAADMEGVSVPVRFLHGARDAFVPPASAEVLCKNRETSLHLLENAGHAIPLEAGVTLCAAIEGDI